MTKFCKSQKFRQSFTSLHPWNKAFYFGASFFCSNLYMLSYTSLLTTWQLSLLLLDQLMETLFFFAPHFIEKNMASDTDCLWWCRRSTGRSWRKGDAWFPPRRFYPIAPPLKRRQRMNVKAKSTFSLYFLQQKPNKACCRTKVISGGYIETRAKYLGFDFHPQQTRGYM